MKWKISTALLACIVIILMVSGNIKDNSARKEFLEEMEHGTESSADIISVLIQYCDENRSVDEIVEVALGAKYRLKHVYFIARHLQAYSGRDFIPESRVFVNMSSFVGSCVEDGNINEEELNIIRDMRDDLVTFNRQLVSEENRVDYELSYKEINSMLSPLDYKWETFHIDTKIGNEDVSKTELKSDIRQFFESSHEQLTINHVDEEAYPVSEYFKNRLADLFYKNMETEWRDATTDAYDIALKVDGYKPLYINLEFESAWFEGEEELYRIKGIGYLWHRVIMKIVEGQPTYYSFEKLIFSKINRQSDDTKDEIVLFYDGDIRLRVKDDEVIVSQEAYSEKAFGFGQQFYCGIPDVNVQGEYIESLDLILVTISHYSMRYGKFTRAAFYKYEDGAIKTVWSDNSIDYLWDEIDLNVGKSELSFVGENFYETVKIDQEDINYNVPPEMKEKLEAADENSHIDVTGYIGYNQGRLLFADYDGDEELEMIILAGFRVYGAASPVGFRDKAILVYELYSDRVEFSEALFSSESEAISEKYEELLELAQ